MSATRTLAVIACGALAAPLRRMAAGRRPEIEVHVLSALLHNRPSEIAPTAERLAGSLLAEGKEVVFAYADCGTYGALDEVCARLGLRRLPGLHCYDLMAGPEQVAALLEKEPGTYLLTDFLVRSFERTVVDELGLDAHPELVADYFAHYRRIVWLREDLDSELEQEAARISQLLGLPLETHPVGNERLLNEFASLLGVGA